MANKDLGFIPDGPKQNLGFTSDIREDKGSNLEDVARGVAQGATLGFADELTGAAEAASKLPELGLDLPELLKAYEKSRDESRQAYAASEERSPVLNTLAQVAGGGLLGGGLGIAAKGLQGVAGIGKAAQLAKAGLTGLPEVEGAGLIANLTKAAGTGIVGGGIAGAGQSEDISNLPSDILTGAKYGALSGAAASGLLGLGKGLVKGIKNTELSKDVADHLKGAIKFGETEGKEGFNVASKSGIESATEKLSEVAPQIGEGILSSQKVVGKELGGIRDLMRSSGVEVPTNPTITEVMEAVKKLQKGTYEDKQAANEILTRIKDFTTHKIEVPFEQKIPQVVKEIPRKASSKEALEKEVEKLKFESSQLGEDAKYNIVESPDKKFISIQKTVDEPVGMAEKLVKTSKEGPEELIKTGEGYQSKSQLLKTQENLPEVPASMEEVSPERLIKENISIEAQKKIEDTFENAEKLKNQLNALTQGTSLDASPQAKGTLRNITSNLDNKLNNIEGISKELQSKYNTSLKKNTAIYQAMGELGLSKDDIIQFANSDKPELVTTIKNKLIDRLANFGTDKAAGAKSTELINRVVGLVEVANPELAQTLGPKLKETARAYDLARKAAELKFYRASLLTSGPIRAAGAVGEFIGKTKLDLSKATPEQLQQIVQTSGKGARNAVKALSGLSKAVLKNDPTGRAAAMNALQQNPSYKPTLNQIENKDNKEE